MSEISEKFWYLSGDNKIDRFDYDPIYTDYDL